MSEEAFRIMTQMDLEGAETQAVLQCAPLLTGCLLYTSDAADD